ASGLAAGQRVNQCIQRIGDPCLVNGREELHEGGLHRETVFFRGHPTVAVTVIESYLFAGKERDRIEQWSMLFAQQAQSVLIGDAKFNILSDDDCGRLIRTLWSQRKAEEPFFIPNDAIPILAPRRITRAHSTIVRNG